MLPNVVLETAAAKWLHHLINVAIPATLAMVLKPKKDFLRSLKHKHCCCNLQPSHPLTAPPNVARRTNLKLTCPKDPR